MACGVTLDNTIRTRISLPPLVSLSLLFYPSFTAFRTVTKIQINQKYFDYDSMPSSFTFRTTGYRHRTERSGCSDCVTEPTHRQEARYQAGNDAAASHGQDAVARV